MHNVAVLGGGIFAREAHLPAIKEAKDFSLKAVWSRSQGSAEAVRAEADKLGFSSSSDIKTCWDSSSSGSSSTSNADGDLKALLARSDIQTVILSLPILSQPDTIKQAWQAGKHVISEKPVAKDVATGKALIELWESEFKPKGLHWIIAEQWPYEPVIAAARQKVESGDIGELRSFSLNWYSYNAPDMKYNLTPWRKEPEYQGGYLLDGGVHLAAGIRWILEGFKGTSLQKISATSLQRQPHLPPVDTLIGTARASNDVVGNFNISYGDEQDFPKRLTIKGSKGVITIQPKMKEGKMIQKLKVKSPSGKIASENYEGRGVKEEMAAFAKALSSGTDFEAIYARSGPRAALRDVAFIEGGLKSSDSESWFDISQI